MDNQTLEQVAALVMQGMISIVFIWAWSQERAERQKAADKYDAERQKTAEKHAAERDIWMKELISLAREAYGLRPASTQEIPRASKVQDV